MPYKLDLFAVFIFLGVVQGLFLSTFFFSRASRKSPSNIFQGIMIVSLTATIVEIFLMYTGYIIHCLYLVDFSEPFAFLIGPSLLLMVLSSTREKFSPWNYLHFVFPVVYLILLIPFLVLPEDAKFNAWIHSYNIDVPARAYEYDRDPRMFWLTDNHTDFAILSLAFYGVLALVEVIRAFRQKHQSFFKTQNPVLSKLREGVLQLIIVTILIVVIKLFNPDDTGDHMFAAYVSIVIYLLSFRVMAQSGFFQQATLSEPKRYKNSSLTADQQAALTHKLLKLMEEQKPFLNQEFSLPELADKLGTSVHTLSQVINVGLNKTFFEMTAEYRIEEAKKLLKDRVNIKVEEIAEQVGYSSKSSFNTAFKKLTGFTPSEFRGR